jgi:hypothetical protein
LLTFEGTTDPKAVALKIAELHGQFNIRALAFDRWRIADLERERDAIGCNVELIPFGQGFKDLSPAVDVLEPGPDDGGRQCQGRAGCRGKPEAIQAAQYWAH